jgi:hypothetical protein
MGQEEKSFIFKQRSNLNTMTIILKSIVRCEILSLDKRFKGTCFDHVFKKKCKYAITNKKIGLKNNLFQSSLHNLICKYI